MSYREELGYKTLLMNIMDNGIPHSDRTGVGTRRILGETMKFDLSNNRIPVFTTKKVHWKSVVVELLWFLSGQTNINFLKNHGVRIWNEWASANGELGPVYGEQFRYQKSVNELGHGYAIDPLMKFVDEIRRNPDSRRHIISLWNSPLLGMMNLPPCHGVAIQASVLDGGLYIEMYQRSCDMFLGVPFNVASYSLFTHMIAKECGLEAKGFIWHGHDCHIYDNHHMQVHTQMDRGIKKAPTLKLGNYGELFEMLRAIRVENPTTEMIMDNFVLEGYDPHPAIKAEVAV